MIKYVSTKIACELLGVHPNTLRKWAKDGTIEHIRTGTGQRKYDLRKFEKRGSGTLVVYCRVSSAKQKEDLERQAQSLREKYPTADLIKDIGSGLNYKRVGLRTILERSLKGEAITVVVAHKDRLARFGFELIEFILQQSGGKILVLNSETKSPEQELTQDLLTILHVFSCRMHGLRKYRNQIKEDKNLSECRTTFPAS